MMKPTMRAHFMNAKITPRSLFSQPSMMSLMQPSRTLPRTESAAMTTMKTRVKDIMLMTGPDAWTHSVIHVATMLENLYELQTPRISEAIPMIWRIRPFMNPFTRKGMKQIRIIMSTMLIYSKTVSYICKFKCRNWTAAVNCKIIQKI